jgi:hypothetical protein
VAAAVNEAVAAIMAAEQQQQQQQPVNQQRQQHTGFQPELALVFASCNYGSQLPGLVAAVREAAPSVKHIFGCTVRVRGAGVLQRGC